MIQGARQIFSVSINFIQSLIRVKEISGNDTVLDLLESYKIQLGKYHKVVLNEGKQEGNELITETVMQEHKQKFMKQRVFSFFVQALISLLALSLSPPLARAFSQSFSAFP